MVKTTSCIQSFSTSSPTAEHVSADTISSSSSSSSSSSKYKGVRKRKWGKWVSEIRLPNSRERLWLGSYDSAEKAARAFDAAQYCLRGHDSKFNFPENPPQIVGGRSLSPHEIQAVAARFANEVEIATPPAPSNNNIDIIHNNNNNVGTTEQYTSSSSVSVSVSASEGGVANTQVDQDTDHEIMNWSSFLSMLDNNQGISDYGFTYPGLGYLPGDQFYPPPPNNMDDNLDVDDQNGGDGFSQSSFLWNF